MTHIETKLHGRDPHVSTPHPRDEPANPGISAPRSDICDHAPESPLTDVLQGLARREVRIHEHGFIALLDTMPRLVPEGQTADAAIVQAARVSYGQGTKRVNEDRGLIRYLLRHRHTTPFEMVEFKFHISMPIFIARQWIRHRTANVNEYSGRYSIMPDHFYRPSLDAVRKQSATNRQGGSETFAVADGTKGQKDRGTEGAGTSGFHPPVADGGGAEHREAKGVSPDAGCRMPDAESRTPHDFLALLDRAEALYPEYERLLEAGVSREMARIALPLSTYTQWYWKCDLHNILHFLKLRLDPHAQEEIRLYAQAMLDLIEPIVPITIEAFRDYELESMRLTRLEIEALRKRLAGDDADAGAQLDTTNRREQREWEEKLEALSRR